MSSNPTPLLSPTLVNQARELAGAIRQGEIAPLVGAGISLASGLPSWENLTRRMMLAWKE